MERAPSDKTQKSYSPELSEDVEKRKTVKENAQQSHEKSFVVTWKNAPDPSANPKEWSKRRKWATTVVVSGYSLISPVTSSIVAPSLRTIARELHMKSPIIMQMSLSIFVLGFAFGPLVLSPLSEIFGRKWVLQAGNLFFLVFNIACGFANTAEALIACRFLSGIGGSAPLGIGGGVLSDIWTKEERAQAVSIYALGPLIGPAIGPVAGGFIAQYSTWRWGFWATSIADALLQFASLFFLEETFAPVLLERQAKKLRHETGNPDWCVDTGFGPGLDSKHGSLKHVRQIIGIALLRPFKLLMFRPTVQAMSLFMAYTYGLIYLLLSSFALLWQERYHERPDISGLNYIALALGMLIGVQIGMRLQNKIYKHFKTKNNDDGRPEYRLPLILAGAIIMPVGVLIYAWTADAKALWVGPDFGVAIVGCGTVLTMTCISGYMIESFPQVAASAMAAATCLRSLAGFGFALFAPYLFEGLGYGWGGTLLAGVAVCVGIPAPVLLWIYGERMRDKGEARALHHK